jgi:hypothetical protein
MVIRQTYIRFWKEGPRGRIAKEDQDILYSESGDMDCIDLPQRRDQWRALVNTAMNFQFPYIIVGISSNSTLKEWCLLGCYAVWLL